MTKRTLGWVAILVLCLFSCARACGEAGKLVFSGSYLDISDFEQFANRAKKSGATHIDLNYSLPRRLWEYDTEGDPYPAWVINTPTLLKTAVPTRLEKYLPKEYSDLLLSILEQRCRVLRKLGLKGSMQFQDPSMLPEKVFTDYPLWRGARVDHPARSRVARFAPTIDDPEVLELYRESVSILLGRCPELDLITVVTNDSGAGLDWSPGLYSGRFGNTLYRDRTMEQRIASFFEALQGGAKSVGCSLELNIRQTREPDPARISHKLRPGTAIENLEGPDAAPFKASAGVKENWGNVFEPVYGIPRPVAFVNSLARIQKNKAKRVEIAVGEALHREFYFSLYDKAKGVSFQDPADIYSFLRTFASENFGPEKASEYLRLWQAIDEAEMHIRLLNTGGYIFVLGTVHQRWLTRPFVPFPHELTQDEKGYYRKFQFQALSEEYANSLSDIQATDVYSGWSGRHFTRRVLDAVEDRIRRASQIALQVGDGTLSRRLQVFNCLVVNARGAVSYQAQLDRIKQLGIKPLSHSVIDSQSDWDRQMMMETARAEIDNAAVLIALLGDNPGNFLMLAPARELEDITLLGPDISNHLKRKIDIMNSKWEDYKRVFTTPNW
ncbi:MAG: hypothetical protein SFV32_03575 [Opitutaceae bacterium]|nr:hypothetical protein [Opitutaceae bacterium]